MTAGEDRDDQGDQTHQVQVQVAKSQALLNGHRGSHPRPATYRRDHRIVPDSAAADRICYRTVTASASLLPGNRVSGPPLGAPRRNADTSSIGRTAPSGDHSVDLPLVVPSPRGVLDHFMPGVRAALPEPHHASPLDMTTATSTRKRSTRKIGRAGCPFRPVTCSVMPLQAAAVAATPSGAHSAVTNATPPAGTEEHGMDPVIRQGRVSAGQRAGTGTRTRNFPITRQHAVIRLMSGDV